MSEKTIKEIIGDSVMLSELSDKQMYELRQAMKPKTPKRNEIDLETVTGVRKDWFTPEQYFSVKGRKDKCPVCKTNLREEAKINIVFSKVSANYAVCKACSDDLISKGVTDILKRQQDHDMEKNQLIEDILANSAVGYYYKDVARKHSYNSSGYLPGKNIEQLKNIREEQIAEKNRLDEIERRIQEEYVETPMEQYLVDEYGCYEDSKFLKHELQIEEHFKDSSEEFDCGQGYAESEITKLVKIGNKFYNVTITAEIGSAKQDRGDRLYWVESIESVSYEEVDKPQPKDYQVHQYSFSLNKDQKVVLDAFIKANKFQQL